MKIHVTGASGSGATTRLLSWARMYEERGGDPTVRSREMQEKWLSKVSCPVLRLNGELATPSLASAALQALAER